MKIAIRADASSEIGTGHVVRCRSLAQELVQRGAHVRFICRAHRGNLIASLIEQNFEVSVLSTDGASATFQPSGYSSWLGVDQLEDARQTVISGCRPDWMIVDHYGIDAGWESVVRETGCKVLVVDDLANRRHVADALLDQNYSDALETRYRDLVPRTCNRLLGPRYALLSGEYAARRLTLRQRSGDVRRVMIFFGGSDQGDATGLAVDALSCEALADVEADVIVGVNYPHIERLREKAAKRGNTIVRPPLDTLVDVMAEADLAIGAGGTTTWERLCLGVPSVIVTIADNQVPASTALDRDKLAVYAGDVRDLDVNRLRETLVRVIRDSSFVRKLSETGKELVDGCGRSRVADVLLEGS